MRQRVDKIYREKASAKTVKGRPELERAIDALGVNDVLVLAEWDRVTRSMMDGITIIQHVADLLIATSKSKPILNREINFRKYMKMKVLSPVNG